MLRVDQKTAIVTGGGSGIGAASSELLAAEGANVVVTDVNEQAAEETCQKIREKGGKAISLHQNVTDKNRWQEIIDRATVEYGSLDILVNNAGISGSADSIEDLSLEDFRSVMEINLDAVFLGCQAAIRAMKEGTGSIINISSIMGLVGCARPAYNASKGGVRLLTKSVAVHCGSSSYNIRCNSIHPGYIWTPMVQQGVGSREGIETEDQLKQMLVESHPIGRLGDSNDIAQGVLFLASDDSSFMTGSELVIDGGYTAV